jgi:adenylate cyclase
VIRLENLDRCFHGIVPGVIATSDRNGVPNVSYISQVHLIDERHVALSCQFFNKTRQNLDENPRATLELYDPLTFEAYHAALQFLRSETEGQLFESMAVRIQAIASHYGMTGIFKLRSADVFRVLSIEKNVGYITVADDADRSDLPEGPLTEIRALQVVSERVMRACDLDTLLTSALSALDEVFGFTHSMVLMPDEHGDRLVTVASHGYGDEGIGAEVRIGDGLIGTVAEAKRLLRISSLGSAMSYGRTVREEYRDDARGLGAEVPLPGLADAKSQMAIPLLVEGRCIGVLALECRDALTFEQWHEAFLQVLANQIASSIDRLSDRDDAEVPVPSVQQPAVLRASPSKKRSFCYYKNDDCVFVDGEYLIRNIPGKILWKVLRAYQIDGRTDFANRELRLDPSLGLPVLKDNLESRLILLRKRLEQKCPDVRIVPTKRGRFALSVDAQLDLVERETA